MRRFQTIFKQKCPYLRPLLSITFPQGLRISKNIGHPTSGSGGEKTVKRYLKSEHTDGHTDGQPDRQTDISTYRKHRPRGPMLWKASVNVCCTTWGLLPFLSSAGSGSVHSKQKNKLKLWGSNFLPFCLIESSQPSMHLCQLLPCLYILPSPFSGAHPLGGAMAS